LTTKQIISTVDRTPGANRRLVKVAVQCSADTFVVNQSLILRINICGENRHLRQAPKRYLQAKKNQPHKLHIWFLPTLKANAQKTKRAISCQRLK
jgi:hypothetical protein